MLVRHYEDSDFPTLLQWLGERKTPQFKREYLPKSGWIVDGIVAAFLFKTDSKAAIIDGFVTNPNVSHQKRLEACDLLIRRIEDEAVKAGATSLVGYSKILKVHALAVRSGFKYDPTPYFLVFKQIGDSTDGRDESNPKQFTTTTTSPRIWEVV